MMRYHISQSIAGLLDLLAHGCEVDWLTNDDGSVATIEDIMEAIQSAQGKGYTVLPPCGNVSSTGHCAGHEVPRNRLATCPLYFSRAIPAADDWDSRLILVLSPFGVPFFPECATCKYGTLDGTAIQDDIESFYPVKLCRIKFSD